MPTNKHKLESAIAKYQAAIDKNTSESATLWDRYNALLLFNSLLLALGAFSTSFNYFMQVAFDLAPNVGYVNAANAASIALLTVVSALIFHDDLSVRKMVGVIGVTVGLFMLFL